MKSSFPFLAPFLFLIFYGFKGSIEKFQPQNNNDFVSGIYLTHHPVSDKNAQTIRDFFKKLAPVDWKIINPLVVRRNAGESLIDAAIILLATKGWIDLSRYSLQDIEITELPDHTYVDLKKFEFPEASVLAVSEEDYLPNPMEKLKELLANSARRFESLQKIIAVGKLFDVIYLVKNMAGPFIGRDHQESNSVWIPFHPNKDGHTVIYLVHNPTNGSDEPVLWAEISFDPKDSQMVGEIKLTDLSSQKE